QMPGLWKGRAIRHRLCQGWVALRTRTSVHPGLAQPSSTLVGQATSLEERVGNREGQSRPALINVSILRLPSMAWLVKLRLSYASGVPAPTGSEVSQRAARTYDNRNHNLASHK